MATKSHPRTHALLVGIDAYSAGINPLKGCVRDVDAVQRLLVDRLEVSRDDVIRLASPHPGASHEADVPSAPATRAALVAALERLGGERVGPDDRVFIYYSGHGTSVAAEAADGAVTRREALVPADVKVDRGCARGLLYDVELNRLLAGVTARTRQVTFVLDCCHSGGATRDVLGATADGERAARIDRAVGPEDAGADDARAVGVDAAGSVGDCLVVTACLADEKALECADERGQRHGLLTQTLLGALAATSPDELATVPWGRIWRRVVAGVERRNPQHPTLTGSFARPVFGGPPRAGDAGLGVKRTFDGYQLDAGELEDVTEGAVVAVYGSEPAVFPALGSDDDLRHRRGLLRVTKAERTSAKAAAVGAAFELPEGARGRVVEGGEGARLRVAVPEGEDALRAAVGASKLLAVAEAGEVGDVGLARDAAGVLTVTDALHGTEDPYLVKIPADRVDRAAALLEHYARYAAPLRLSERCTDLPGALRMQILDCRGEPFVGGEFRGDDPDTRGLPEVPRGPDGVYDLADGDLVCVQVANASREKLRVWLFDCAPEGYVVLLGDAIVGAGERHRFWHPDGVGRAIDMSVQGGRAASHDRVVAVGTTETGKDLSRLEMDAAETFEAVLRAERGMARKSAGAAAERWTAARATLRTHAG